MADPSAPPSPSSGSPVLVGDSASLARALLSGLPRDDARAVVDRLDGSGSGSHRARRHRELPTDPGRPVGYSSEELDRLAAEPWRGH
jgi:hypothetical protein